MCRLFALHAGRRPVDATVWLLEAPVSLVAQSHRHPDGCGLATFDRDGRPTVDKTPLAAHAAEAFAHQARDARSTTFLAHLRYASVGGLTYENTHPFTFDGRVLGHNGIVGDLDRVEAELGDLRGALRGTSDSERFFALIARHVRDHDGDVRAGIASATRWLAAHVELYSLNFVMASADEVWALRYPEGNELWLLDRPADPAPLDEHGSYGEIGVHVEVDHPLVVVASERMDDDPRWEPVEPGELVHVDADLKVTRELILPRPPARQMVLSGRAADSQADGGDRVRT